MILKNIITNIYSTFLLILIAFLAIGFYVEISDDCRDNTMMFLDEGSSKYFSPPCLMSNGVDNIDKLKYFARNNHLKIVKYVDVIKMKIYERDKDCFNSSAGALSNSHSLITELLFSANMAPWHKSRWNKDGTWNW